MSYHSTSKDNIVRHNISYNFAFGSKSLSFIFLKILRDKKNDIRKRQVHNKKKLFIIIPQDDELSLHFQRQYCPP